MFAGDGVRRSDASAGLLLIAPANDGISRVLLLRRSRAVPGPGLWNLPGGGLEDNESPWQGAHREALEESGYNPKIHGGSPLWSVEKVERHRRPKTYTTYAIGLTAMFTPKLDTESDAYTWVTVEKALTMRLHPGLRQMAETLVVEAQPDCGPEAAGGL